MDLEIYDYYTPRSLTVHKYLWYDEGYNDILPDKNVKILDIGCGFGTFLQYLQKKGYKNIEGVDLSLRQVKATKELGIKAEQINSLTDFLKDKKWDYITLNHVVEHWKKEDTVKYLKAIKASLNKGGKIVVEVPNMMLLSGMKYAFSEFDHISAFTNTTLIEILKISGFKNIKIKGIDKTNFKRTPKFLLWYTLRKIWLWILDKIYLLEIGERIVLSKALRAIAENCED